MAILKKYKDEISLISYDNTLSTPLMWICSKNMEFTIKYIFENYDASQLMLNHKNNIHYTVLSLLCKYCSEQNIMIFLEKYKDDIQIPDNWMDGKFFFEYVCFRKMENVIKFLIENYTASEVFPGVGVGILNGYGYGFRALCKYCSEPLIQMFIDKYDKYDNDGFELERKVFFV